MGKNKYIEQVSNNYFNQLEITWAKSGKPMTNCVNDCDLNEYFVQVNLSFCSQSKIKNPNTQLCTLITNK